MRQVVYNNDLGGFCLHDKTLCEYALRKYKPAQIKNVDEIKGYVAFHIQLNNGEDIYPSDIPRHDTILIDVVKKIEWDIDKYSPLRICEVEGLYYIENYDGAETILDSAKLTEENGWH